MPQVKHQPTDLMMFISRVDASIPRSKIFETFSNLKIGFIDRIIEKPFYDDPHGKFVIIKFRTWVDNPISEKIMKRFDAGKDIKIIYDEPWYWIATKYVKQSAP